MTIVFLFNKYRKLLIILCIAVGIIVFGVLFILYKNEEARLSLWKEAEDTFHNDLFGDNVYIFTPKDDPAKVQEVLNDIYSTTGSVLYCQGWNRYGQKYQQSSGER